MSNQRPEEVTISQSVAILIDGNNIERSIHDETGDKQTMLNFDTLIPRLLDNRGLNRLIYFREGKNISAKLQERLYTNYHGSVRPCHKTADIPLTINAMQIASKVDTIIIMSGDSDYIELVRHLKTEGVRVEIAAVSRTTSRLLREEADYFHEITQDDWFTLAPKKSVKRREPKKPQPARELKNADGNTS
ncbi:MAG: NYN domain-containing protein [Proteobacteria bacterium]|nr:NYN domain-containing protein [Pseudomonadota bacterium]